MSLNCGIGIGEGSEEVFVGDNTTEYTFVPKLVTYGNIIHALSLLKVCSTLIITEEEETRTTSNCDPPSKGLSTQQEHYVVRPANIKVCRDIMERRQQLTGTNIYIYRYQGCGLFRLCDNH